MSKRRARRMAGRSQEAQVPLAPSVGHIGKQYATWSGPDGSWKTLTDLLGLSGLPGPASLSDAMRNTAFLLCSDVLAQDISKATLRMYRRVDDVRREEIKPNEHSLAELLAGDPNEYHTWMDLWDMVIRHFAISQNAFIAKRITTRGDIRALVPVVPGRVVITIDVDDGDIFYRVTRGTNFDRAALRTFGEDLTTEQMIHVKGRMVDGIMGYSTLLAGAGAISLAAAVNTYLSKLYAGGGSRKAVMTLNEDKALSNEQFQRLRAQFKEVMRRAQDNDEPIILENGADVRMLSMTAQEAEISIANKAAITDVCRLFRMPPHKVMHFDSIKYDNIDAMERVYVSDTLVPTALRVEKALERALLRRDERSKYILEFDRDEMTASDSKTRAEIVKVGVQTGVMTLDEGRRELGYDPLPNKAGEVRAIPVNVTLVDDKNEPVLDGTAGAPGDNPTTDPLQQPATPPKAPAKDMRH